MREGSATPSSILLRTWATGQAQARQGKQGGKGKALGALALSPPQLLLARLSPGIVVGWRIGELVFGRPPPSNNAMGHPAGLGDLPVSSFGARPTSGTTPGPARSKKYSVLEKQCEEAREAKGKTYCVFGGLGLMGGNRRPLEVIHKYM